jgi:hypothetical protein
MTRFTGAGLDVFVVGETNTGFDSFRTFAHLAFCARAIFNREAFDIRRFGADGNADADVIPVGWCVFGDVPEPFSDSITAIALSNFSTCDCASLRSARSCWSAFVRFPIVTPSDLTARLIVEGRVCKCLAGRAFWRIPSPDVSLEPTLLSYGRGVCHLNIVNRSEIIRGLLEALVNWR